METIGFVGAVGTKATAMAECFGPEGARTNGR